MNNTAKVDNDAMYFNPLLEKFSYPIVRTGCILLSDIPITDELGLKARDAIDKSTSVNKNGGRYFDLIKSFSESGLKFKRKVKSKEAFRWHNENRRILDSPEVVLQLGKFEILARHCLTVCSSERKSKVWSRYTLRGVHDIPADSLDQGQTQEFYKAVSSFSTKFTAKWRELYLSDLAAVGIRSQSFFPYPLEVSAANYPSVKVSTLRRSLAAGNALTSEIILEKNKAITESLLTIGSEPLFGAQLEFNDAVQRVRKSKRSDLELIIHDLRHAGESLSKSEELTSVFLLTTRPKGAFYFGLCGNSRVEAEPETSESPYRKTKGTAHEATGLLLEHYASKF